MTIPPTSGLQDSDYAQAITIVASGIATSSAIAGLSAPGVPAGTIAAIFATIATISASLSAFFRSKGH